MAIVKVIEIMAESEKSWEDATKMAVQEAALTVQNIKSVYIKEMQAIVENNQIKAYRTNCKLSFVVDDSARHK